MGRQDFDDNFDIGCVALFNERCTEATSASLSWVMRTTRPLMGAVLNSFHELTLVSCAAARDELGLANVGSYGPVFDGN